MMRRKRHQLCPIVLGKSTKQPTQQVKKPTKRQKVVDAENDLLKKAIECMDRTTGETGTSADGFEHFGRYVATELRAITNPQGQRWAKLQIQNVLYNAAQSDAVPPHSQPPMDTHYPFYYPAFQGDRSTSVSTRTPSLSPTPSFVERP